MLDFIAVMRVFEGILFGVFMASSLCLWGGYFLLKCNIFIFLFQGDFVSLFLLLLLFVWLRCRNFLSHKEAECMFTNPFLIFFFDFCVLMPYGSSCILVDVNENAAFLS